MKKIIIFTIICMAAFTACQQTIKTPVVDLEAERVAINTVFDGFNSAFLIEDVDSLVSYLDDDMMIYGSAPTQLWNKAEIAEIWREGFAAMDIGYEVFGDRFVMIAADGNSASVVEQYMMHAFSDVLPFRNSYHLIKRNETWKILLINSSIIANDEDIPKINAALAAE